jgi:hypothetical protein
MDTTASGTDQPPAVVHRAPRTLGRIRSERVPRLRRSPRFYLTYLDEPQATGDLSVPAGSCLVLRSIGGDDPRLVEVRLPDDSTAGIARLRRGSSVGVASPESLAAVVSLGTVFVDWTSPDGVRRTSWLRVPPIPARYRTLAG